VLLLATLSSLRIEARGDGSRLLAQPALQAQYFKHSKHSTSSTASTASTVYTLRAQGALLQARGRGALCHPLQCMPAKKEDHGDTKATHRHWRLESIFKIL